MGQVLLSHKQQDLWAVGKMSDRSKKQSGVAEMAQQLRVHVALTEDWHSVPRTMSVVHNHL